MHIFYTCMIKFWPLYTQHPGKTLSAIISHIVFMALHIFFSPNSLAKSSTTSSLNIYRLSTSIGVPSPDFPPSNAKTQAPGHEIRKWTTKNQYCPDYKPLKSLSESSEMHEKSQKVCSSTSHRIYR